MNKKMLGRKIVNLSCMYCLANFLDVSFEELIDMAEDFKKQGCDLF